MDATLSYKTRLFLKKQIDEHKHMIRQLEEQIDIIDRTSNGTMNVRTGTWFDIE